jgi:hypothetical protein
MATVTAPTDGRPQFSMADLAVASYLLGHQSLPDVQQILPGTDRYVLPNSWPTPKPTPTNSFSSAVAASQAAPEAPKSSAAARALWPALR